MLAAEVRHYKLFSFAGNTRHYVGKVGGSNVALQGGIISVEWFSLGADCGGIFTIISEIRLAFPG